MDNQNIKYSYHKKIKNSSNPVILIITSAYPADNEDGQGVIIAKLAENLALLNINIIILAPHYLGLPFLYHKKNVKIYRFPYFFPLKLEILAKNPGIFYHVSNSFIGSIQFPFLLLSEMISTFIICRKEHVELIHSQWIIPHGFIGMIISYLLQIPHITSIHGTDVTITKQYPSLSKVIKIIGKRCNLVTANSNYIREKYLSCDINLHKPVIIPMGVDLTLINNSNIKNHNYFNNDPLILFIGRLIKWKGVHILIKVMDLLIKDYKNAKLVIIGNGFCFSKLKNIVSYLNLDTSIKFTGNISENEIINWYSKADIFVLPSILDNNMTEGLGVVLLEAMASGVPVIGSNIGGIPDIIDNDINGLLVPPGDSLALKNAIIRILKDPALADKFSKNGLKTVSDKYSWDKIALRFYNEYKSLLNT